MKTKISLDTNAVNALFPEGTEARIELQNAVIANIAKATMVRQADAVYSEVQRALNLNELELRKEMEKLVVNYAPKSGFYLTSDAKDTVKKETNDMLRAEVNRVLESAIGESSYYVEDLVKTRFDYFMNEAIDAKIKERFKSVSIDLAVHISKALTEDT